MEVVSSGIDRWADRLRRLDLIPWFRGEAIPFLDSEKDPRGERPYSPRMMIALLLYAYCTGIYSSRRIARATYEDIPFRVLAGESHPHFTTINEFRLVHLEALKALFLEALKLCQIEELLERARTIDQEEDERLGVEETEEDIPAELARRESRLARIREAKAALEQDAARARAEKLRRQAEEQQSKADDALWIGWSRSERELEPRRQERRLTSSNHPQTQLNEVMDGRIIAFLQMWTAHRGPTLRGTSPTQTAGSC